MMIRASVRRCCRQDESRLIAALRCPRPHYYTMTQSVLYIFLKGLMDPLGQSQVLK